jgi:PucR C-terminal helix-turn-helix domain
VPTVDELLRHPASRGVTQVAGPWDARPAGSVVIVDSLGELERAREHAVALLTPHASSNAVGYQLDRALRAAGERRLAALAVYGAATTSVTALRLADRARVALLTIDSHVDMTDLAFGLARLIRADPGGVLNRSLDALAAVLAAEPKGTQAVLAAAGTAVGGPFAIRPRAEGEVAVQIVADGRAEDWVCAERDDQSALLAAHLVAAAVGRIRTLAIKAARRPAQARADALAALLTAPGPRALDRARDVGIRLDAELAVVRLEVTPPATDDLAARRAFEEELDDLVLAAADGSSSAAYGTSSWAEGASSRAERASSRAYGDSPAAYWPSRHAYDPSGAWYRTRFDDALLLVHAGEPGPLPVARVLGAIRDAFPRATVFCGVGAHLRGADGLRESAGQAATATAAARAWNRPGSALHVDEVGLPPLIVDWLGSRAAQDSARRTLAPLAELPRAETAVRTLQVYLDERGSLARSAERLHLHKNAVAYRIRRIRSQLDGIDLDDPERRLELQLACRAWLVGR